MGSLDKWRKFLKGSGTDICNLIEHAILVAASDCPDELSRKRDRIAERLYASRIVKCCGCTSVTLAKPHDETIDDEDAEEGITGCHDKNSDKANSGIGETDGIRISDYSYDEARALSEEIEDGSPALKEAFKIRDIIANPYTSVTELYECLRRLELTQLTVEILKQTHIGKQVNQLRKHNSKEIQSMVKRLIRSWKEIVDEWMKTTENVVVAASAVTLPDSVSPAIANDENGLPSPPLDEWAFLSTQTTSIEISQHIEEETNPEYEKAIMIFDVMDDNGNPHAAEKTKNDGYDDYYDAGGKRCTIKRPNKIKQSAHQRNLARDSNKIKQSAHQRNLARDSNAFCEPETNTQIQVVREQGHKLSSSSPMVANSKYKVSRDNVQQHPDLAKNQTKPDSFPLPNQKSKSLDDATVKVKLQAARRKLQEGYQQVENAKKRRMVQVIQLQELPKHHHRQSMNNRRY